MQKKLVDLHHAWRELQKNSKKYTKFRSAVKDFQNNLDSLFAIAHADALKRMKIEEDKLF